MKDFIDTCLVSSSPWSCVLRQALVLGLVSRLTWHSVLLPLCLWLLSAEVRDGSCQHPLVFHSPWSYLQGGDFCYSFQSFTSVIKGCLSVCAYLRAGTSSSSLWALLLAGVLRCPVVQSSWVTMSWNWLEAILNFLLWWHPSPHLVFMVLFQRTVAWMCLSFDAFCLKALFKLKFL